MSKCIVKSCSNHKHQGRFHGNMCLPCHTALQLVSDFKNKIRCSREVLLDLFTDTEELLKSNNDSITNLRGEVVLCEITGWGINSTPRKEYLKRVDGEYFTADGSSFGDGWRIKEISNE